MAFSKLQYTNPSERFEVKVFIFERDIFFIILGHRKENSCPFFEFFIDTVVKNAFYVSRWTIWKKKKLLEQKFGHVSRILSGFFSTFVGVFPTALSKLHSKCPKEHLERKDFFRKKMFFFNQFGRLRQTFQPLGRNFFRRSVKSALNVSK